MKVSVALCTYNGGKYIEEQVTSIMQQSVVPDEVIVCDDRSTDDTVEVIKLLQRKYANLILFINEKNLGAKKNFEKAIDLTTGDFIFLSDQDDVWMPGKVQLFLEEFNRKPNVLAIFSDGFLLFDQGISQDKSLWETFGFNEVEMMQHNQSFLFSYINYFDNIVTGAALAFRKEAKEIILPFKMNDDELHDYWICTALAQQGLIAPLPDKTFAYRIHPGQQVGIVNKEYIKSLNKAKRKFIYREESLSIKEEFQILWLGYIRYKRLAVLFGRESNGIKAFGKDLKSRLKDFFSKLDNYERLFYKSKWMFKKAKTIIQ